MLVDRRIRRFIENGSIFWYGKVIPAQDRDDKLKRERPESFPVCLRDGSVLVAPLELVLVWGFHSSIRC